MSWYRLAMNYVRIVVSIIIGSALIAVPLRTEAATLSTATLQQKINTVRVAKHVANLRLNVRLNTVARLRAQDIIRASKLSHGTKTTTVSAIMRQVGYQATASGEMIAADYQTATEMVSAWSQSLNHRNILLGKKYQDIGIAIVKNPSGYPFSTLVVVVVGKRSGL